MDLLRRGRARGEFERFVASSAERLLRTAYLVVWDRAEAEDLVQECLLRVARRWSRVRSMRQPEGYARRILINLALDRADARAHRRGELEPPDGGRFVDLVDEASSRDLEAIERKAELLAAIATLAPRQRVVLVLRYFEDLPEAQVAEILGCSLGTVKSTASRALTRLRQALDPDRAPDSAAASAATGPQPTTRKE
jgi:RNA polymerase sigma-70 factor (sigma-E family)